jgi:hypothetical protein
MQLSIARTVQPPMPAPTPAPIFALVLKPGTDWFDVGVDIWVTDGEVSSDVDDASGVEVEVMRLEVDEELAEALLGLEEALAVAVVGTVLGLLPLRNVKGPPIDVGRTTIIPRFLEAVKAIRRNEVSVGHQQAGAGPTTWTLSVDESLHKVHWSDVPLQYTSPAHC